MSHDYYLTRWRQRRPPKEAPRKEERKAKMLTLEDLKKVVKPGTRISLAELQVAMRERRHV
jgi:hypothetical protein